MTDQTKKELSEMLDDVVEMKHTNTPTYWLILAGLGGLATAIIVALLKFTGLVLLVIAASAFIMNNLLMAWRQMRDAEKKANKVKETKAKRKAAAAGKVLTELSKP